MKVKSDHSSKFSNLSNWKEEALKNQGFNGIRTRDLHDTGVVLHQLSYEAPHWERDGWRCDIIGGMEKKSLSQDLCQCVISKFKYS